MTNGQLSYHVQAFSHYLPKPMADGVLVTFWLEGESTFNGSNCYN